MLNPSWLSLKTVGYLGGKKWGGVAHGASDRCFLLSVLLLLVREVEQILA